MEPILIVRPFVVLVGGWHPLNAKEVQVTLGLIGIWSTIVGHKVLKIFRMDDYFNVKYNHKNNKQIKWFLEPNFT